jgi:hypothetical protein
VEGLGLEADQLHTCSGEVKNAWSCASTLPYVVMAAQGQHYLDHCFTHSKSGLRKLC